MKMNSANSSQDDRKRQNDRYCLRDAPAHVECGFDPIVHLALVPPRLRCLNSIAG